MGETIYTQGQVGWMNGFMGYCVEQGLGDIIEFGTCTGNSTKHIGMLWGSDNGNVFTIDGWKGLPKSEKELPHNGRWDEGSFTGDKNSTEKLLSPYKNITMIDSWINELKEPKEYGIKMIVGANIDVDIYESTMESLNYLLGCSWVNNEVIIRFDDWDNPAGGDIKLREQVSFHNKKAYEDFLEMNNKLESTQLSCDDYVAIFKLKKERNG